MAFLCFIYLTASILEGGWVLSFTSYPAVRMLSIACLSCGAVMVIGNLSQPDGLWANILELCFIREFVESLQRILLSCWSLLIAVQVIGSMLGQPMDLQSSLQSNRLEAPCFVFKAHIYYTFCM